MKYLYSEDSRVNGSAKLVVGVFFAAFAGWFLYATYHAIMMPGAYISDIILSLLALTFLVKRAAGSYRYVLTETAVVLEERSIFGNRTFEIPLDDIDGICESTKDIFRRIKFRRTYKLHSSLDDRRTWMLVYSVVEGGKMIHIRAAIKVTEQFLHELDNMVPGRVNITLNEVSFFALIREEAYRTGYRDVAQYRADLKAGVLDEDD